MWLNLLLLDHLQLASVNDILLVSRLKTNSISISEEEDTLSFTLGTLGLLDELADTWSSEKSTDESPGSSAGVGAVVLAHDFLDAFSGFVRVVEGDSRDEVVSNVGLDDSVEDVTADETELTVDGGGGSAGVGPGLWVIVWESWVGVLEVGDGDEPMVDPEVWETVENHNVPPAPLLDSKVQAVGSDGNTEVRVKDQVSILILVQWRAGIKMVDTTKPSVALSLSTALRLTLVAVVTGDVGDEVHWPSEKLLKHEVDEGRGWRLLNELTKLVAVLSKLFNAGLWNENHVSLHVSSSLVVLGVRNLPRVVRDQKSRVHPPSHKIIDSLGWRESTVTTLMSQNPDTSSEQALNEGIEKVCDESQFLGRNQWDVLVSEVESGSNVDEIADNVGHGPDVGSLKAVSWDSITDLLDGEIWDLELVSVGVEKRLSDWLRLIVREGGYRGGESWRWRRIRGGIVGEVASSRNGAWPGRDGISTTSASRGWSHGGSCAEDSSPVL